jgi:hypothetical protein
MQWLLDADRAEIGLPIAAAFARFWQLRDHLSEGEARLVELIGASSAVAAPSIEYWRAATAVRGTAGVSAPGGGRRRSEVGVGASGPSLA